VAFWTDRPVFVTGATGLLGSHMTAGAAGPRRQPRVPGPRPGRAEPLPAPRPRPQVVIVRGCLEDYALLERSLNEHEIDTVMHLGAQTIVGTASRNPLSTWESNVRGSYLLLEACRRNAKKVRRVVVASSDKAYGDQPNLPYTEDAPLDRPLPLRLLQELHRPDRPLVLRDLPAPRVRHPLRQPVRPRRPQLEPHRPRHDPLGHPRRATDRPLRRQLRPRLRLRRRRRGRLPRPRRADDRPGDRRRGLQLLRRAARRASSRSSPASSPPPAAPTSSPSILGQASHEIRAQFLASAKGPRRASAGARASASTRASPPPSPGTASCWPEGHVRSQTIGGRPRLHRRPPPRRAPRRPSRSAARARPPSPVPPSCGPAAAGRDLPPSSTNSTSPPPRARSPRCPASRRVSQLGRGLRPTTPVPFRESDASAPRPTTARPNTTASSPSRPPVQRLRGPRDPPPRRSSTAPARPRRC
jgi:hypothetical protein